MAVRAVVGITGSTGQLGQELIRQSSKSLAISRVFPTEPIDAIIHCAAPNFRDESDVIAFGEFNRQLKDYVTDFGVSNLVIVGSWWQFAEGECANISYTKMKNQQQEMFPHAVHVAPFSIYGDSVRSGRGFIPQLVEAIRNDQPLQGLSNQLRDFVHVSDVARAMIRALSCPAGTYHSGTGNVISPKDLANSFGMYAPDFSEWPSATPKYPIEALPGWKPKINLISHIKQALRVV